MGKDVLASPEELTDQRVLHPDLFAQLSGEGSRVVLAELYLVSEKRSGGMPLSVVWTSSTPLPRSRSAARAMSRTLTMREVSTSTGHTASRRSARGHDGSER
jgi:hypothetical protein